MVEACEVGTGILRAPMLPHNVGHMWIKGKEERIMVATRGRASEVAVNATRHGQDGEGVRL